MRNIRVQTAAVTVLVASLAAFGIHALNAQTATFKRTVLQKGDLSVPGREAVQVRAEFEPGAAVGRHTHPGEEIGYILSGTLELDVAGKPPVTLKAGDHFMIPKGVVHDGKNVGSDNAVVLATYIIEKGKPIATMVK